MKTRNLFVTAMCLLASNMAFAQTIHNIVFCDTNDKKIGESVSLDNDRELEEVEDIAGFIGYKIINYVYNGDKCTKSNLMSVIGTLNPGSNDVVVFYYSGHGTHAPNQENDKYPQMLLNSRFEGDFVPLRIVEEQLNQKPHGLLLILSDCCNNVVNGVSQKSVFDGMTSATIAKSNEVANYKRLFVESKGKVIATGCRLKQTSLALNKGGLFSLAFWDALYSECSEGNNPGWLNVMRNTSKETAAIAASRFNHKQEPYFDVNVNDAPNTVTTPTPPPAPVQPVTNLPPLATNSSLATLLASLLAQSTDARLAMIPQIMSTRFANGGHVVTLGRDLKTIVDYEDAAVFLRRIATSDKIVHINVVREETAQDGLPYITVTEMRK